MSGFMKRSGKFEMGKRGGGRGDDREEEGDE